MIILGFLLGKELPIMFIGYHYIPVLSEPELTMNGGLIMISESSNFGQLKIEGVIWAENI